MLKYLFYTAPKMLFEPFARAALISFACILLLRKKKNALLFRSLTGIVLFMIAWRLSIHSLMRSSRYAQILIYPCIILSGCLCLNTQALFRWLFRKIRLNFPCRKEICKFLPTVLFVSFMIAGIGKSLHIDPYGNYIQNITNAYQKYARKQDHIHIMDSEQHRIAWYLKRKINDFQTFNADKGIDSVRKAVESLKNIPGNNYLFFYLEKGEKVPSAQSMNFDKDSGSWEILERFYTSRKKRKEIILARYRPVCPNIKEWKEKVPELPADNIFKFGNFEQPVAGTALKNLENYYKKNQIKGYSDLSTRKIPSGWWLVLNQWNKNNPPDIRLSEKNPLAGKFSLLADARPPLYSAVFSGSYLNTPSRYVVFVRGEGNQPSRIQISAYSRNLQTNTYKKTLLSGNFLIQPGKVYRIHGEIPCDKFDQGFQNFCLYFVIKGYVSLDQAALTPLKR